MFHPRSRRIDDLPYPARVQRSFFFSPVSHSLSPPNRKFKVIENLSMEFSIPFFSLIIYALVNVAVSAVVVTEHFGNEELHLLSV